MSTVNNTPGTLAAALIAFQAEMPRINKGETAIVKPKQGNSYKYSYADLADVSAELLPVMTKFGLGFSSRPTMQDGQFVLVYSLVHVSGEREEGTFPLPAGGSPQAVGSAITYARRYCLLAVTGAAPDDEDDDAQAAMNTKPAPVPPEERETPEEREFVTEVQRRIDEASSREELNRLYEKVKDASGKGLTTKNATDLKNRMQGRAKQLEKSANAA